MVKKEIDWGDVFFYALITVTAAFLIWFIGFIIHEAVEQEQWYNSLSVEEKAEVDRERAAAYQANIHTYEVVGVAKYVRTKTNTMGGVLDTDICYAFEYIDGNGNLKSVADFEHLEYGLTKVVIGDTDAYIINTNGEDTRTLQLTKETLKTIQTLNSG